MRRWAIVLALLSAVRSGSPLAAELEIAVEGLVDARFLAADAERVWLDAGLDKLRFSDGDEPLRLGAALVELKARITPTLSGRLTLGTYDAHDTVLGATEAYVVVAPVPRSALRVRARAGAFYPPLTLANGDVAWTSPYTLSFSAIDSWIGEELRTVGVELELTEMGRFRASPNDFSLTVALFRFNDPAGAILSWRGWALHDRQTRLGERLPLAPLPNFQPGGLYYPVQGAFDEPFVEIDGRTGWYAAAEWQRLDRSRLRAFHYDNRGDPTVVEGGQWTWWTRFDHLGWQLRLSPRTEVVLQALNGDTRMDDFAGPLVDNTFWAASILVSYERGAHRASLRADRFGVDDEDRTPADPNDERGNAWTAAYFYAPERPFLGSLAVGRLRFGGELLLVDSRRPARRLLGEPDSRSEKSLQLALQWRYP